MLNTKLVTFLHSFSRFDLAQFSKYLASPFFNEKEELVHFFEQLVELELLAGKSEKNFGKLEFWKRLYPGLAYDDVRFRRLCSDLLRLAMDFTAYNQYAANPTTGQVFLLHALANTRLEKHFDGVLRQAELLQKKAGLRDADFHYLSYKMHRRRHEHLEHISPKTAAFDPIEKADYHLDCYYFAKKLEHYCDALGYRNMVSETAKVALFPEFLKYLEQSPYLSEPVVKAWYLVARMMLDPDEAHFFLEMKMLLETEATSFQPKELQTLFIHSMNYCIDTKVNIGRGDYLSELFSLYRIALYREIIFDNGELNPHHYKNIITISLQISELAWAENFIRDYTHRLPKSDQENALNFNLAHVYYYQKKYDQVIELLQEVEYQNIAYSLGSRILLIRTYFEQREDQALDSLIDSYSIFLRRNRLISKDVKQQYLNMLRFTRKLFALATFDKKGIEKTLREIKNCKSLAAKQWLLEKAGEMAGTHSTNNF
ncbi:MAG: hypothetical protein K9J37_21700 [Saprospiraceae bacterium]|nr:hypothetical protein [Saprospiraceae bacterium]MCF8252536.1 hypothetical protein [Saprospiraceae bacterium]MCF8282577.1 hypothetical protein [Bacteroidales bacterium]MCF8310783.1 hypothetical protein [Saprospiraceae bacterium]MCF8439386.1 hypothetical protein [Saprospiraceae bacterium]